MKKFLTGTIAVLAALSLANSAQASTASHREALEAAQSYLRSGHFSKAGLIEQLESPYGEDFSHSDARWAVAHVHANWNAEAVEAAKSYLRSGHFSRRSLIEQLESPYGEHFTHAQAVYGVSKAYH
jgi:cellobiose-specific phosphotransferase system component IIA